MKKKGKTVRSLNTQGAESKLETGVTGTTSVLWKALPAGTLDSGWSQTTKASRGEPTSFHTWVQEESGIQRTDPEHLRELESSLPARSVRLGAQGLNWGTSAQST